MNDKEELAVDIMNAASVEETDGGWVVDREYMADALWAAGWRKMPSKEDVLSAMAVEYYKHVLADHPHRHELWERQADAVLALMGGEVSE